MTSLGGRYTTLRARDGKEYLIPNETLITNQVVNWSYTSPFVRLDVPFGVAYGSDLRLVRRLAIEAAKETRRVQSSPEPVCHVTEFGDNAINLLLRFWISDPANGVVNIKGDVFLALWDRFVAHGIEVPFPQRDLRIQRPAARSRCSRGRRRRRGARRRIRRATAARVRSRSALAITEPSEGSSRRWRSSG